MIRTAVLLTVYNRKNVTLHGLQSLFRSIKGLGGEYVFDVYMTDDGSSDGTGDVVKLTFPDVNVIRGNGTLYWGGGMRLAWQSAIKSGINYDFFLWYNDDSVLFDNALQNMFDIVNSNCIVTGAFCDSNKTPSYGGRDKDNNILEPIGTPQEVLMMNGNFVLVPYNIFSTIGYITPHFAHGGGDFDYGFRAQKAGYKILLSKEYVGVSDRHDEFIPKYCDQDNSLIKRWNLLHNPVNSPFDHFKFNLKYIGFAFAFKSFLICYIGVFTPCIYKKLKKNFCKKTY